MTAIVILAAGASTRLGRPKQNLIYKSETLLNKVLTAAKAVADNIYIVVGAHSDVVRSGIAEDNVTVLNNPDWATGMASSIHVAVNHMMQNQPSITAILFLVCDQPHVNAELLKHIIERAKASEKGIIACNYSNTLGVPALFKQQYFNDLLKLKGQEGAKKLLIAHQADVEAAPFALGNIDIDTEEDYKKLTSQYN
ncbi:nucleotidyltransferase family protein [Mucilaginibacter sp. KACC 22063]|uniref:nucleotidyltransferase family protein n=1 Tax=Mucilaginibacter sp. KACC 22063 TaxID=3025666 RepID=UPI0023667F36|nr:nucleotidyltransferase family protein [Mucilaginibacter sp. KACC 22063]WDF55650.1 nucleotidyltransferase family protein [Mucilaginibacter sp. KACC 22063]